MIARPDRKPDYEALYDYWFAEKLYEFDGLMQRMRLLDGELCGFELGEWVPFGNHVQRAYYNWLAAQLLAP